MLEHPGRIYLGFKFHLENLVDNKSVRSEMQWISLPKQRYLKTAMVLLLTGGRDPLAIEFQKGER